MTILYKKLDSVASGNGVGVVYLVQAPDAPKDLHQLGGRGCVLRRPSKHDEHRRSGLVSQLKDLLD